MNFSHLLARLRRLRPPKPKPRLILALLLLPVLLSPPILLLFAPSLPRLALEPLRMAYRHISSPPSSTAPLTLPAWIALSPRRSCLSRIGPPGAANRGARARCCIRALRAEMPLALSAADAPTLRSRGFGDDFVARLPHVGLKAYLEDVAGGGLGRCAIVSSAPTLSMKKFGVDLAEEIDSADVVIRVNRQIVKGFEKFVGRKRGVRIVNLHKGVMESRVVKAALKGGGVFIRDEQWERGAKWNVSRGWNVRRLGAKGALDQFMKVTTKNPEANVFLNHPVFAQFALQHVHTTLVGGDKRSLSSGAQAVMLGLMLCDKVVSYEIASEDELSQKFRYYYDKRPRGYKWWHPKDEEVAVLEVLTSEKRPGTDIREYDMSGAECGDFI